MQKTPILGKEGWPQGQGGGLKSQGLPHFKSFYTPELKEKVYRLFKPDFETLGYTFDGKATQILSP